MLSAKRANPFAAAPLPTSSNRIRRNTLDRRAERARTRSPCQSCRIRHCRVMVANGVRDCTRGVSRAVSESLTALDKMPQFFDKVFHDVASS